MHKKLTLFDLSWPIFLENLLMRSLGIVNLFMLAKFSEDAVGAVGVSERIIGMLGVLFSIIGIGTSVSINQYLGSKQEKIAKKVAFIALFINFFIGLFVSVILLLFAEPFLKMMNVEASVRGYGVTYLRIVGSFLFLQALIRTIGSIFRCYGYTKFSLYMAVLINFVNLIGNYLVVYRPFHFPDFGLVGIASSVVLGNIIAVIIMSITLYRMLDIHLSIKKLIPFPYRLLRDILLIGLPSAGEFISYNLSQLFIVSFVGLVSSYALTTQVVTQKVMDFIWILGISIGQATLILVGHNVGARNYEEAYQTGLKSLRYAVIIDTILAIVVFTLARPILDIFSDNSLVIKVGVTLLFVTIFLEPGRAFNLVIGNSLRGAGDVFYPIIMGILSMWLISVPFSYILGIHFGFGLIGFWIAFTLDEWTRGIILFIRFKKGKWKLKRVVK